MKKPIFKAWVKATDKEKGPPRRSQHWAAARRGLFKIFDDRIECGNWKIPFDKIEHVTEYRVRSWLSFFTRHSILEVKTPEATYQFGFNPWSKPTRSLPFDVEQKDVKLQHSRFSAAIYIFLIAYILYVIFF